MWIWRWRKKSDVDELNSICMQSENDEDDEKMQLALDLVSETHGMSHLPSPLDPDLKEKYSFEHTIPQLPKGSTDLFSKRSSILRNKILNEKQRLEITVPYSPVSRSGIDDDENKDNHALVDRMCVTGFREKTEDTHSCSTFIEHEFE